MSKLYFMIGLPRSGKSTKALSWRNPINGINSRVIVCADVIRLSLYEHRFFIGGESMVHAIKYTMIDSLLKSDYDVLVDGTHTTEKSIKELLHIDKNARYLFVDTPVEECKKRAIASEQSDLLPVIDRMESQLEKIREDLKNDTFALAKSWGMGTIQ